MRAGQPVHAASVAVVPDLLEFSASVDAIDHVSLGTTTDSSGRFVVALPPKGSVELRITAQKSGVVRIPLRSVEHLPPITELGDVELDRPIPVTVTLDGYDGCELYAAGPVGAAGLNIIESRRDATERRRLEIPEPGRWMLTLICAGTDVPVLPPFVDLVAQDTDAQVHLVPYGPPP